jgi:xylulokinase
VSLLGIDVGTTGTKAAAFTTGGRQLVSAYVEYDFRHPAPGWAELDSAEVWRLIQHAIRRVVADTASDPIRAISVSSMGEAMVPVSQDRQILGPSINPNFDLRGEGCLQLLASEMDNERLYRLNGNTLGHHYSLPTLKWLKEHQPDRYRGTHKFLLWGSLVPYMLGAEPGVDLSGQPHASIRLGAGGLVSRAVGLGRARPGQAPRHDALGHHARSRLTAGSGGPGPFSGSCAGRRLP